MPTNLKRVQLGYHEDWGTQLARIEALTHLRKLDLDLSTIEDE